MKANLLLIEDDHEISELLNALLSKEGFNITSAFDGEIGLSIALEQNFDVVILDIMLPKKDGLEVLRELRAKKTTPVLMLTAKGEDIDRIIGFEMGADDYLPKPFNPRELIARIKALIRRVHYDNQAPTDIPSIEFQGIRLDAKRREVQVNGQQLELTTAEYNILFELMTKPGEVISKANLTEKALGRKFSLYDRAIDMHLSNLRKKLGDECANKAIKTIRGVGYLFATEASRDEA